MNKVLLAYEDYSEMLTIQSVLKKVGFDVLTTSSEFSLSEQVLSFNPEIIIGYGKGPKVSTLGVGRRLKDMPRWTGRVILIFPAGMKTDPADLAKVRMDMALEAPLEVTRLLQVLGNYTGQDSRALVEKMMKAVAQEGEQRASAAAAPRADEPVFVTGAKETVESWNVKGGKELDDFDRLMGTSSEASKKGQNVASSKETQGTGPTMISRPKDSEDEKKASVEGTASSGEPSAISLVVSDPLAEKEKAEALKARVRGYERFLERLPVPTVNGHKLKEVKKAQKGVSETWSQEEMKAQDQLRRDFTKHLFKKND